jgi:hypothetical protein
VRIAKLERVEAARVDPPLVANGAVAGRAITAERRDFMHLHADGTPMTAEELTASQQPKPKPDPEPAAA